jgi:GTP-binding protein YchF
MKRVDILGLPGSGKTTLFEILMQGAGTSSPGASGREQVGVVRVPDERVDRLSALYEPKKTTYAQVQFVDSAAARGAGESGRAQAKGPDLFSSVRNCDAFLAVVRDFDNPAVPIEGGVRPGRDLANLQADLILNDLAIVESRLEKIGRELRIGKKQNEREAAMLERWKALLEAERPLRGERFEGEEEKLLRGFQLLSLKPLLAVINQDDAPGRPVPEAPDTMTVALRAHLEREIVALPPEERAAFRAELGVSEDGLSLIIRACYQLLGLISFFTTGPDEVRAWTIRRGEKAVDAAGEIHTDLAKGFIRAEVISYAQLLEAGGHPRAREKGWLRLEGRDYEVQDGDCLEIRFNK